LDAVREQSRATQVLLSNATASAVEGDTLVLTLPTAPLARRLGDERNTEMIKTALRTVLGVDWRVRCEHTGGDPLPRAASRQPQRSRPPQRPPERPARQPERRPAGRPGRPDDGIPPPPEPPDPAEPPEPDPDDPGPVPRFLPPPVRPPVPPDDEAAMLAEAADPNPVQHNPKHPDDVALELLAEHLGARRLDR
jgi:DNA polymerase-3 subunit gamma/tau